MDQPKPFKVSELTFLIQRKLESDPIFRGAKVTGEVSNLRAPNSAGHLYFTLKDANAQINCAMFRSVAAQYLSDLPKNGEEITVLGDISVYPPQGSYQLIVRGVEKGGKEGLLHQKFLALKAKLEAEGLFSADQKKPIPAIPKRIGVVTSPTGAVIKDITHTLQRRFPHVTLVLAPAVVQGDAGAASIVSALKSLNESRDIDVILLARGGGSLEDLWCFNEEVVARAIFASQVPVISGVGHETDFTIADFVADLRAATPTAAAEQAVPLASQLYGELALAEDQLKSRLKFFTQSRQQQLDDIEFRMQVRMNALIDTHRQTLNQALKDMEHGFWNSLQRARHELSMMEAKLEATDMRNVLKRGFSVTTLAGKTVLNAAELKPGDEIVTHFHTGKSTSTITNTDTHE